jgi:hypothetical protein
MQRIAEIFSLYGKFGDFFTFVTLTSWPFDLDVEGQVFMYQMKANMFIYNMSKFLADTTTIKLLVNFLISELMFFGLNKKLRLVERSFVLPDISCSHSQRVKELSPYTYLCFHRFE